MPRHTFTGNVQCHRQFPSRTLGNSRDILVYLPPGYLRFRRQQYPVLYLQDGQNVFDAATAFAGVEWGVDETAQRLIRQRLIEPLIIVAVANTGWIGFTNTLRHVVSSTPRESGKSAVAVWPGSMRN